MLMSKSTNGKMVENTCCLLKDVAYLFGEFAKVII